MLEEKAIVRSNRAEGEKATFDMNLQFFEKTNTWLASSRSAWVKETWSLPSNLWA